MELIYLFTALPLIALFLPRLISSFGLKSGDPAPLSTPDIKKAVRDNPTAVVYFYTANCPACKIMTPVLAKLKRVKDLPVVKVNARKEPDAARDYKVMGVPATFIIKDGLIHERITGAKDEGHIRSKL